MTAPFSVVIPAHNEAKVIVRCLAALYDGAPADARPEVIVVCNGCTDDTAALARSAAPEATIVELEVGSKPLALNTGNDAATVVPRFFVDADVVAPYSALCAAAQALSAGDIKAAAPAIDVDTRASDAFVKAYYRVWLRQPYARGPMVGSGVYGLSAAGLSEVGQFPAIISDDGYVRTRFSPEERRRVAEDGLGHPVQFTVFAPRTVGDLVRIESRRRAGDAELAAQFPNAHTGRTNSAGDFVKAPSSPIDLAFYFAIKTAGRLQYRRNRARGRQNVWERDESSR